jgi:hypothetical protein
MAAHDSFKPVNYVFVDFENVAQIDHAVIGARTVHFTLLLGAKQTKLDAALVEKLLENAASVQLVRLSSSGKNALDFTLAYYLGRTASADPGAFYHIVSKDTGFDPLIEHLKSRHIRAQRHDAFATLQFGVTTTPAAPLPSPAAPSAPAKAPVAKTKPSPAPTAKDALTRVTEHLRKNRTNRPKKKKTLLGHLRSMLGTEATEADATKLMQELQGLGHIRIGDKNSVTYTL